MSESKKQFVRIWVELDMHEVQDHLLISDESIGSCAKCREIGIDLKKNENCPKCGTKFLYATARPHGSQKQSDPRVVARIRAKRPDLQIIDWGDYDHGRGKASARDFFKI